MSRDLATGVTVIKLGGSVLTGHKAMLGAAASIAGRVSDQSTKLLIIVSAELGHTDSLLDEARAIFDAPDASTLDLLWSTGELRSVALFTLALKRHGVDAIGLNVHEAGLQSTDQGLTLNPTALRRALAKHDVVVAPGFLATRDQRVVTLGRGGSDLSAVLLAILLRADRCELVKDVDGYFTADPRVDPDATLVRSLNFRAALELADEGCPLVQKQALVAARNANLPIVVRSFESDGTVVGGPATSGFLTSRLSDFRNPVVF